MRRFGFEMNILRSCWHTVSKTQAHSIYKTFGSISLQFES